MLERLDWPFLRGYAKAIPSRPGLAARGLLFAMKKLPFSVRLFYLLV